MRTLRSCVALLAIVLFAQAASAQLSSRSVDVNGVAREYLLYVPTGYDGTRDLPLMLVYHGGASTSMDMLFLVDMRSLADADDVLLVYPQGLPDTAGDPIWNSEGPYSNGVDEIGYTSAMIDDLDIDYAVDTSRVYACGYSNGANMAWELACLLSERIAAVGPVAGSMWEWTEGLCSPTRPVPVLSIHGTQDFYNPYGGGPPFSLGLIEASEVWVQYNGANPVPSIASVPNTVPGDGSTVQHYVWGDGDGCTAVEHYRVDNGGHDWPGVFGNMDIDATQLIWDFCMQYDLSGLISCSTCSITQIGVGSGGANIGTLASPSTPLLGSTLQFDYSGFSGSTFGVLVASMENLAVSALGGTLFPNPGNAAAILGVSTAADGSGSVSIGLGLNPALVGQSGYTQVLVLDNAQSGGLAFSNGLEILFCN